MLRKIGTISAVSAWLGLAAGASATTITTGFTAISSNSGLQANIASELSAAWTVMSASDLRVTLSFSASPTVGTVEQLYFLDIGNALGAATITSTSDPTHIQFHLGASPGALPGNSNYDADPISALHNGENDSCSHAGRGICPGGSITLDLAVSGFTDALLQADLSNNTLGLGAHVISIGSSSGTSDAFISGPPAPTVTISGRDSPVPEPATLGLLGAGLAGLGAARRRKRS